LSLIRIGIDAPVPPLGEVVESGVMATVAGGAVPVDGAEEGVVVVQPQQMTTSTSRIAYTNAVLIAYDIHILK
jgi:hypothetical protein